MKIWLDDRRAPPDSSWKWVDSAQVMKNMLDDSALDVTAISLDHDLGDETLYGNGYQVLLYIEERVFRDRDYAPPHVSIHTDNPVALDKMRAALASISRFLLR